MNLIHKVFELLFVYYLECQPSQYGDSVKKIFILQNGNPQMPPKRIIVTPRLCEDWQKLLQRISDEVRPIRGYVRSLRTPVEGKLVRDYRSLQDGQVYLAVCEWETFIPAKRATNYNLNSNPPPLFKVGNSGRDFPLSRIVESAGTSVPYCFFPPFEEKHKPFRSKWNN